MEARESVSSFPGGVLSGRYAPTPVRKGAELAHRGYKGIKDAFRARRYSSIVLWGSSIFFIFSLFAFLFSLPSHTDAAWGATPYAPAAAIAQPSVQTLELHIANNGLVLLRGARVSSINGTTLTVKTAWGTTNFTWVVNTNALNYETRKFGTHFLDNKGNQISLDDVRVGDFVTVTGMLDGSAPQPTLAADSVRRL